MNPRKPTVIFPPLRIDDSSTSRSLLESWMLFPGLRDDHKSKFLRWAHMRNAFLDEMKHQLRFYNAQFKRIPAEKSIAVSEQASEIITLVPKKAVTSEFVLMRAADLARLLIRPPALSSKLAKKQSADAALAGSLLIYMRLLEQREPYHSSFTQAAIIAKKRNPEKGKTKHSPQSIEPREYMASDTAAKVWAQFEAVSHLWAALHALRGFNFKPNLKPLAGVFVPDLLSISSQYANWGADFFSNTMNSALRKNKRFEFLSVEYSGELESNSYDFCELPQDNLAMEFIRKI